MTNQIIVRLAALAMCLIMCFAATSCTFISEVAKVSEYIDFTIELIDAVKSGNLEDAERFLHPQAIVTVEDIQKMLENKKEDIDAFYSADASEWVEDGNSIDSFDVKKNIRIANPVMGAKYIEELDEFALNIDFTLRPKYESKPGYIRVIARILNNEQGVGIYSLEII